MNQNSCEIASETAMRQPLMVELWCCQDSHTERHGSQSLKAVESVQASCGFEKETGVYVVDFM